MMELPKELAISFFKKISFESSAFTVLIRGLMKKMAIAKDIYEVKRKQTIIQETEV